MNNLIYLIEDIASKQAAIIDPAWDVPQLLDLATKHDLTITDILLTHSHPDHINGIQGILDKFDAQLHLSHAEANFWQPEILTASLHYGGDTIQLGKNEIEIMHTPGHTPGSICYRIENQLFTGDTMFVFGCGHCKLGGDPSILFDTLSKMKKKLPTDTVIHPGHNYAEQITTTMGEQIQGNPFLHFSKRTEFIKFRQQVHSRIRSTPYQAVSPDQTFKMLK